MATRARRTILAGLAAAGGALAAVRADTLTVATYNVENYVAIPRRIDGAFRPAYPKPEAAT